jgi:hypothetical protein
MKNIMDSVRNFLVTEKIRHEAVDDTHVTFDSAVGDTIVTVDEECRKVMVVTILPVCGEQKMRGALAEFVARANHLATMVRLDVNMDDGRALCVTGLLAGDEDLDPGIVRHLVLANLAFAHRWLPGITAVADGLVSPERAIRHGQQRMQERVSRTRSSKTEPSERHGLGGRMGSAFGGSLN